MQIKKLTLIFFLILTIFSLNAPCAYSLSCRHHLINAGKNFIQMLISPVRGIFVTGPENVASAYRCEAYEDETPNKFFGVWRAPGEELKGVLDGLVKTVDYGRKFLWELISIPFSD